jgi:uncharacterized membrane protein YdjX (TVP38/TMEM64 family)
MKFLALLIVLGAAAIAIKGYGLGEYMDAERLRGVIAGVGPWGPIVYILIYSVAPAFLLPGLPITVIGGVLFGPLWGSVYVLVGATIGATVAFIVARRMGRAWVEGLIRNERLKGLDDQVRRQGWKIVAFTRLIPLFPYNLLNYAFGLTGIRLSHYVMATFIFMIPGVVAYVVFSSSILDLARGKVSVEFLIGGLFVALVSLIPMLYRRIRGRMGG